VELTADTVRVAQFVAISAALIALLAAWGRVRSRGHGVLTLETTTSFRGSTT
jgi:predicted small integral membrane protein